MMRFLAATISFLILVSGVFFMYSFFNGKYSLVLVDPEYAKNTAKELLNSLLVVSVVSAVLFSLLVYTVLSVRGAARRLAYKISKDMSFTKEQFRRFYELSPVPYLLIDSKGKITRPNKASLRFFGRTEDELIGENVFSFFTHPEHKEKITRYKDRFTHHIPIEKKEIQVKLDTGEVRWVLLSIEDITTPGTSVHNGLVTLVDIHEQKELERIKTEFLSLASHQLRTPLSNLKWYIDFLLSKRRDQMSDEVQGYLNKMYRRNTDMIELVNTLLNLSRIEMGKVKVEKEKTDIESLVRSVVEELEPNAKEKNIKLDTSYTGNLMLNTDGRLVRIILQNLLSNSLRYTPNGGNVSVRLIGSSSKVRIEVEDNGAGIPPDEQSSIFSKLYRASNAKQIEANGNGIGLYMCKELVEGLGGNISFKSELNKGTTFFVDLPR